MESTILLSQMASVLWYLIPLLIIIGVLKSAWFKGIAGEFKVNLLLNIFLSHKTYHLLKNVTLITEDGTTQIDHIIVSKYGLFVIETKNLKGWIFGSPHQKLWTQKIFKYSQQFQNPLHQNYKHIKTIEQNFQINNNAIFSVIVFIGNSCFKTAMPDNVTNATSFIRYIKSKTHVYFNEDEVNNITQQIEAGRLQQNLTTHFQHVSHVKKIIKAKRGQTKSNQ